MATPITTNTDDNKKKEDQCTPYILIVPLSQSLGVCGGYNESFDASEQHKNPNKRSSIIRLLKPSISENAGITEKIYYIFIKYFFLIGLVICLLIGVLYPKFASSDGPLYPKITSSWICVIIIFLITGIAVRTNQELRSEWQSKSTKLQSEQLNICVLFIIFVILPLFAVLIVEIIKQINSNFDENLLNGLIITCCLPTTIGTAVVFTQNARGNEAASAEITTLSNSFLLSIPMICPALISLFASDIPVGGISLTWGLRVIVPFLFGQIIRSFLGTIRHWMRPKKPYFKKVTEVCLLFIILCAISETFYDGFQSEFTDVIIMLVVVILIHCLSLALVWFLSGIRSKSIDEIVRKTRESSFMEEDEADNEQNCCNNCFVFDIYDRIAITLTSTQKGVGVGVPMIATLYVGKPALVGMCIVPLLLYGIVQLIIGSFMINPLRKKAKKYAKEMYRGLLYGGVTGKRLLTAKSTMARVEAPRRPSTHAIESLFVHDDDDIYE